MSNLTIHDVEEIIRSIKYKDAEISLSRPTNCDDIILGILIFRPDTYKEQNIRPLTHVTQLPLNDLDEKSLVRWIYHMILELEMHEVGEWFMYKGNRLFDPHAKNQPAVEIEED